MPRQYDIVVFGATGFTGKLVCEHLLKHYSGGVVRWAMAGRSKDKLQETKIALAEDGCLGADGIPEILADSFDRASLDAMTIQTKTVITTVGPYMKYGTPLVESCISNSTNYCDITGEIPWVRKMMLTHHHSAKDKGARIVHCCGYDSLPFDLGVHMLCKAQEQIGRELEEVESLVGPGKGAVSGGTIASFLEVARLPAQELKAASDPYCLEPLESTWRGTDKDESNWWGYSRLAEKHTFPFPMAMVNTRIVRRSNALLGHSYGKRFSYKEETQSPGFIVAVIMSIAIAFSKVLLLFGPVRELIIKKMAPKPGQGPSRKTMMEGSWTVDIYGKAVPKEGGAPSVVRGTVAGKHDPGYMDTSRMLLECALALSLQEDELDAAGYCPGGILTPASAVGTIAIDRLRKAGFTFKVQTSGST